MPTELGDFGTAQRESRRIVELALILQDVQSRNRGLRRVGLPEQLLRQRVLPGVHQCRGPLPPPPSIPPACARSARPRPSYLPRSALSSNEAARSDRPDSRDSLLHPRAIIRPLFLRREREIIHESTRDPTFRRPGPIPESLHRRLRLVRQPRLAERPREMKLRFRIVRREFGGAAQHADGVEPSGRAWSTPARAGRASARCPARA